jgi:hypothetical protein
MKCPVCESDIDEKEVLEGDPIICDECEVELVIQDGELVVLDDDEDILLDEEEFGDDGVCTDCE